MQKQSVGIFSGSFNPIHAGHLMLANYICEFTDLDEVWFVVTPHNPLKEAGDLLDDGMRLEMARLALEGYDRMAVSDVEFHMPRPSYTIDTLEKLAGDYPGKEFSLIIGGDNWERFHRWKESGRLVRDYRIFVYPRPGGEEAPQGGSATVVWLARAPMLGISSTFIRESIRDGKNMRAFLPPKVYDYIARNGLYGHAPLTTPCRT